MDGAETASAIRRNSLKSIAIIVAFPFVLPLLLFAIAWVSAAFFGRPDAFAIALRTLLVSLGIMVVGTIVWLPIGYLLNQWIVDQATGARLLSRAELPRVWAILDRLSARCNIRPPALRLIETEALNAYASGLTEATYSVTVTSGLVEMLEEDELEGVIAHELTHIMHHDVRLMVVAGILVGTIPLLHDVAMKAFWAIVMGILNIYRAIFTVLPVPGVRLMVDITYTAVYWIGKVIAFAVGLIATLCSLVLQFSLSRRREFMADAGAVTLTGNPEALASALRKISGNATLDTAITSVRAMCIENQVAWFGLFSTHPPIAERIQALSRLPPRTIEEGPPERDDPEPSAGSTPDHEFYADRRPATLDAATISRYRVLLGRASPELLDVIAREHLYRRARETVENAHAQNPAISPHEIASARAHLEAAIDEIEASLMR